MRVAAWSCCLSAAFRRTVVWAVQAGDTGVMQATDTAVGGGSRPGVPRQAIDIKRRTNGDQHMPRFLIERDLPGAGALSPGDLQGIARKSCDVLHDLGPDIQWVHSYVTKDKITCIYLAPNADIIREH